jgi:protein TonB
MAGTRSMGDWTDVTSEGRNEVVFEGRFKEYGAYVVRVNYNKTLLRAFGLSVAVGVIAISLPVILRAIGANSKKSDTVTTITAHLTAPPPPPPKTPPPPPPPPPPKELVNQLRVTPPVVAKQVLDTIPPPTVHQETQTNVGTTNQKGKDTIIAPISTGNQVIGDQTSNEILTVVQQMPKFDGDLNKYLVSHIQYPEVERDAGISGKVFVTFVVEKDGSITSVKILRGVPGGPGLDKEAIRVITSMPKWSAGMQNGHSVRVQFNLPIDFELR